MGCFKADVQGYPRPFEMVPQNFGGAPGGARMGGMWARALPEAMRSVRQTQETSGGFNPQYCTKKK